MQTLCYRCCYFKFFSKSLDRDPPSLNLFNLLSLWQILSLERVTPKSWLMRYDLNDGLEYILHISKGGVIYQMRLGKGVMITGMMRVSTGKKPMKWGVFINILVIYLLRTMLPSKHQCCYPNWKNLEPQLQVVTHPMAFASLTGPSSKSRKLSRIQRFYKDFQEFRYLYFPLHVIPLYRDSLYLYAMDIILLLVFVIVLVSSGRHLVAFYYIYMNCLTTKSGQISFSIQVNPYHIPSSM